MLTLFIASMGRVAQGHPKLTQRLLARYHYSQTSAFPYTSDPRNLLHILAHLTAINMPLLVPDTPVFGSAIVRVGVIDEERHALIAIDILVVWRWRLIVVMRRTNEDAWNKLLKESGPVT